MPRAPAAPCCLFITCVRQLGFSLPAIINKAGGTLEKTYHALTGKNGGYKAFSKLLAKFFPIGDTPLLPLDNPFPLLDGKARDVYPTATESQDSPPEGSISGTATYNACGRGPTFKLRVDAHQPERTAHLRRACNRIRSAGIQQED
jgi:hypothetical protein